MPSWISPVLMTATTAAVLLPASPALAAPFFESLWDTQTGNSEDAVTNSGAWDRWETNNTDLITVQPIEDEGAPPELAGHNMASVDLIGEPSWAMVTREDVGTDSVDDFYWRMYIRVASTQGTNYNNVHPFQDFEAFDNGDNSMNFYIGLAERTPDRSAWAPYFSSYVPQPETTASTFTLTPDEVDLFLATDKWYRFEGHIEYLSRDGDIARTHYDMRIFDPEGDPDVPVLTSDEFVASNCSNECYGTRLGDFYDEGAAFYFRSTSTTFTFGNNGPASATGEGRMYDVAALALSHDGWIGPFGDESEGGDTGTDGGDSDDDGPADDGAGSDGVADDDGGSTTWGSVDSGEAPDDDGGSTSDMPGATSDGPGDPGQDGDTSGCACEASGSERSGLGWLWGVLVVGLRWQHRTRRAN